MTFHIRQAKVDQQRYFMLKINLPLPPSVNALYGGGSGQQRFKSKAYKAWLISAQVAETKGIIGQVQLTYTFYFPDKRARDCENYCKAVSDFLVANKIIEDDSYRIVPKMLLLFGGIDKVKPRVEVLILPLCN